MKEVRREVLVEKTIYIADDGEEFESLLDCEEHEWDLRQKEQESVAEKLRADLNSVHWPSIANPQGDAAYHWFAVQNEQDLALFCSAYASYDRSLKDVENVKGYVSYPDYICLVDYPLGPEFPQWFTLSKMLAEANAFLAQMPKEIKIIKMEE